MGTLRWSLPRMEHIILSGSLRPTQSQWESTAIYIVMWTMKNTQSSLLKGKINISTSLTHNKNQTQAASIRGEHSTSSSQDQWNLTMFFFDSLD